MKQQKAFNPLQERPSRSAYSNWKSYAAAAGATLAMSTNVQAGTITTGTIDLTVQAGGTHGVSHYKLFTIAGGSVALHAFDNGAVAFVDVNSFSSVAPLKFAGTLEGFHFIAEKYGSGAPIDFAGGQRNPVIQLHNGTAGVQGAFGPGDVEGFLGFEDQAGQFGWLRVEVSDTGSPGYPNELTVLDYAYDNTPGEAIDAGDTGTSATPEPDSVALGLLALGASGILSWRRRRTEAAEAEKLKVE
jgi:MYXO-CTERM domain-containing protein